MADEESPSRQIAIGNYIAQALGDGAKAVINVIQGGNDEKRNLRNRQIMIKKIHNFWIKGALEQSLYGELIQLRLRENLNVVNSHPWDILLHSQEKPDRLLPPDKKLIEVFDDIGRSLLILGEPGSGKTTLLLTLARDLIDRAEEDTSYFIPVVFNLSSWGTRRTNISDWLIDELRTNYLIPKKLAEEWIKRDEILPLFDGLDEVNEEYRNNCVKEINRFHSEHLIPLVVSSRTSDYEVLSERLKFEGAVTLLSLSDIQIELYLRGSKLEIDTLREYLKQDAELRKMASSPLMLSVMVIAYEGNVSIDFKKSTEEEYRELLFDTYISQMLKHRGALLPLNQKLLQLGWLSKQMLESSQSVFLVERMQPSWLSRNDYVLFSLADVIIGLLFEVLLIGLTLGYVVDWKLGLMIGLIFGFSGLIWISKQKMEIKTVEKINLSWGSLWNGVVLFGVIGVLMGFIIGFFVGGGLFGIIELVIGGVQVGLMQGKIFGLACGVIFGLFYYFDFILHFGFYGTEVEQSIKPNHGIWLSFKNAWIGMSANATLGFILGGLALGKVSAIISGVSFLELFWSRDSLFGGFIGGILSFLIGLIAYWSQEKFREKDFFATMLYGIISGGLIGLIFTGSSWNLSYAIIGTITGGLYGWNKKGGETFIKHYILRFLLWRANLLPFNIVPFLDSFVKCIFLRKVGGGYIFIHRMLMEHFAKMYDEQFVQKL